MGELVLAAITASPPTARSAPCWARQVGSGRAWVSASGSRGAPCSLSRLPCRCCGSDSTRVRPGLRVTPLPRL